jgi:hypothetical protein
MRALHILLTTATFAWMAAPLAVHAQALTNEEEAALQLAIDRGQLLYAYDQAAWHGTDDLLAKATATGIQNQIASRTGGWIVDGPSSEPTLLFFDRDTENPQPLYVAAFTEGGTKLAKSRIVTASEPSLITPARKRLIDAHGLAYEAIAASDARLCAQARPNTVTLAPQSPADPVLVYFLTPQTETGKYPFGGHYRVEVSADGKAGDIHPFTNACLTMDLPAATPKNKQPEALVVTHLLDPTPTEIHVFSMLATGLPIYVMTTLNNRTWAVESSGGRARIRLVDRPPQ